MTRFDTAQTQPVQHRGRMAEEYQQSGSNGEQSQVNVGSNERMISVAAGAIATVMGLSRRSVPGFLIAGVGGAMLYRGLTGHCSAYQALGINTAQDEEGDES